ncbi:MAG: hypothetical protein VKJ86_04410 [Synechococcus sp.]|nr:hypothetical protein [Synechococcus sp.]
MYGSPQPQLPQPPAAPRSPKPRSPQVRSSAVHHAHKHKLVFWELVAKISVNCLLTGVAIASIAQLLPAQVNQQQRLVTLKGEVNEAEERVKQLRTEFNRNFDAYAGDKLMQEHTLKVDPKQRRIIWVAPKQTPAQGQPD